jgi:SPP1 gp7 family putative phage head morphogenesis protein
MIAEVNARDKRAWAAASRKIGEGLRREIDATPVGEVIRARLAEQVDLITSLPREAAERVHLLALERISNGERAASLADEIMRTGEVTRSRANLIARTETSRTATELTRARALSVGSTHYVWKTVGDSDVRPDHKKLNGRVFAWDDPPIADARSGARAHPGSIYNCRCWASPIIDDD